MTRFLLQVLVPMLVGTAIAVQAQFMGRIGRSMGTLESIFITYGGGGLLIALAMLLIRGGALGQGGGLPWYVFTTGALGLLIVGGITYSAGRFGLIGAFTVIVTAQFIVSALIDHFGLFGSMVRPLDLSRGVGIGLLLTGVWLILR